MLKYVETFYIVQGGIGLKWTLTEPKNIYMMALSKKKENTLQNWNSYPYHHVKIFTKSKFNIKKGLLNFQKYT